MPWLENKKYLILSKAFVKSKNKAILRTFTLLYYVRNQRNILPHKGLFDVTFLITVNDARQGDNLQAIALVEIL